MHKHLHTILAPVLFFLICTTVTHGKIYKLYYLGGQSNMDGYGYVKELPEKYPSSLARFGILEISFGIGKRSS